MRRLRAGLPLAVITGLVFPGCSAPEPEVASVRVATGASGEERTYPVARFAEPLSPKVRPVGPDTATFGKLVDLAVAGRWLFGADALAREVVRIDTVTGQVTRFGRRGEGPTEFRRPAALSVDGGEVVVFDPAAVRLVMLDAESLEHRGTRFVEGVGYANVPHAVGWLDPGRPVIVSVLFDPGRTTMRDQVARVAVIDVDAQAEVELGRYPTSKLGYHPDGGIVVSPLLASRLHVVAAPPHLVMIRDATPTLRVLDGEGGEIETWSFVGLAPTVAPERGPLEEHYLRSYGGDEDEDVRGYVSRFPVADTLPSFDALAAVSDGEVLVRHLRMSDLPATERRPWLQVCLREPRSVTAVLLPETFAPSARDGARLFGITTDALGVTRPTRAELRPCQG